MFTWLTKNIFGTARTNLMEEVCTITQEEAEALFFETAVARDASSTKIEPPTESKAKPNRIQSPLALFNQYCRNNELSEMDRKLSEIHGEESHGSIDREMSLDDVGLGFRYKNTNALLLAIESQAERLEKESNYAMNFWQKSSMLRKADGIRQQLKTMKDDFNKTAGSNNDDSLFTSLKQVCNGESVDNETLNQLGRLITDRRNGWDCFHRKTKSATILAQQIQQIDLSMSEENAPCRPI